MFQRYCVTNLTSKTLTLSTMRRKVTATRNKSNLNARMAWKNGLLLPVSKVIGWRFKVVQVRTYNYKQIYSIVCLVGLIKGKIRFYLMQGLSHQDLHIHLKIMLAVHVA